jgi:zinc transport system ATP-binding protein
LKPIILSVHDVRFGYNAEPLIEYADFDLYEGDFAAVIGANGAGKSTLLKIILGEVHPQRGAVWLFGQAVSSVTDWTRVAFLPQNCSQGEFSFPATALEVVCAATTARASREQGFFAKRARKSIISAAHDALELTGMRHKANNLMATLSGGERQRVLLARALALKPRLAILDEPTTGVDAQSVTSLFDLLTRLTKENLLTVIMVTHNIASAADSANRIFCIEEGSLEEIAHTQIEKELGVKHTHSAQHHCTQHTEEQHASV